MLEIELFEHLTVYKQMTDGYMNRQLHIAILGTI